LNSLPPAQTDETPTSPTVPQEGPSPLAVAEFLRQRPSFFQDHPELLSGLTLSHHAGAKTVSLVERQVEVLRQRYKALELRLAELLRHGDENDAITQKLHQWALPLLSVGDPAQLPGQITAGLRKTFDVTQVALRIWGSGAPAPDQDWAQPIEATTRQWADTHLLPVCGPLAEPEVLRWFEDGAASTQSMARMALRVGTSPHAFGMLVLGSPDPNRFDAAMGTAFLQRIAEIASASLARLLSGYGHRT